MIIRRDSAAYVAAVTEALRAGTLPLTELSTMCPECGQTQGPYRYLDNDNHLVVLVDEDTPGSSEVAVVIGCEGYWAINPAKVGIDSPNWQDWLNWESAGADTPGGQYAASRHQTDDATRAVYHISPYVDGKWWLELIQMRDSEQIDTLFWPPLASEADAKAAAAAAERAESPDLR